MSGGSAGSKQYKEFAKGLAGLRRSPCVGAHFVRSVRSWLQSTSAAFAMRPEQVTPPSMPQLGHDLLNNPLYLGP